MYGHKKGISDTIAVHPVPGLDWFVSSFDRGFGNRFYYRGKVILIHFTIKTIIDRFNNRNYFLNLGRIYPIKQSFLI